MDIKKEKRKAFIAIQTMKDSIKNLEEKNGDLANDNESRATVISDQQIKIKELNSNIKKMNEEKTISQHVVTGLKYSVPSAGFAGALTLLLAERLGLSDLEIQAMTTLLTISINVGIIVVKKYLGK